MSLNAVVSFGAFEGPALQDAKDEHNYANLEGYMYYEFIFFGMIGISCGLLAALFNSINVKITHIRNKHLTNRFFRVVEVVIICIITSTATFWSPTFFSCHTPMDLATTCAGVPGNNLSQERLLEMCPDTREGSAFSEAYLASQICGDNATCAEPHLEEVKK